jgi:hypothetical protein|nr:MAG TPA: hypothetical protein [Caudoviricetes sp.]
MKQKQNKNVDQIMKEQLELLAEVSNDYKCDPEQLVAISLAMVEIAKNQINYL